MDLNFVVAFFAVAVVLTLSFFLRKVFKNLSAYMVSVFFLMFTVVFFINYARNNFLKGYLDYSVFAFYFAVLCVLSLGIYKIILFVKDFFGSDN